MRVLRLVNGRTPHPVQFRTGAHVDQAHARVELQQFEGFRGSKCARVGQRVLGGAVGGLLVELFERAHGAVVSVKSASDYSSLAVAGDFRKQGACNVGA